MASIRDTVNHQVRIRARFDRTLDNEGKRRQARDAAFKAGSGVTIREGQQFDAGWDAAMRLVVAPLNFALQQAEAERIALADEYRHTLASSVKLTEHEAALEIQRVIDEAKISA